MKPLGAVEIGTVHTFLQALYHESYMKLTEKIVKSLTKMFTVVQTFERKQ